MIGQIYAARLHEAGHEVTVLARHQTLQTLTQDGIILVNHARPDPPVQRVPVRVEVTAEVGSDRSFELALVTVRRDQAGDILPALATCRPAWWSRCRPTRWTWPTSATSSATTARFSASPASAGTAGTTGASITSRSRSSPPPWDGSGAGRK